jgi:hypothetical protein
MTFAFIRPGLDVVADWLQLWANGLRSPTASREAAGRSVLAAVHEDPDLTVQQRVALEELYEAFRDVNRGRRRGN